MFTLQKKWQELFLRLSAEFAIVVLGVTIALWADSWVANRGDREEEIARLHALQDNVTETLEDLRDERDNAVDAAGALRQLTSQLELPAEQLRLLLRFGFLYGATFSPELNVYDDLKNSGELALLTNRDLRRSLATMDSRLEVLEMAQSDLTSVQQLEIDSYAMDHTNLRLFFGDDVGLDWVAVDKEHDFKFISDIHFQNRILFKLDLVTTLVHSFGEAEAVLIKVQQAIAMQLGGEEQ